MLRVTRPLQKARAVNATTTSFNAVVPTTTEPAADAGSGTGAAVIDLSPAGGVLVPRFMLLFPYGTGDADDVFDMRLTGWFRTAPNSLWLPTIIASLTCTMSTATGVAGADVVATEFFADTLAVLSEPTVTADVTRAGTLQLYSPANNTLAWALVPIPPVEKVQFEFDTTTGNPTGCNCLWALVG